MCPKPLINSGFLAFMKFSEIPKSDQKISHRSLTKAFIIRVCFTIQYLCRLRLMIRCRGLQFKIVWRNGKDEENNCSNCCIRTGSFGWMWKKADPIDLPSSGGVTSIEFVTLTEAKVDITEARHIKKIMDALKTAEPTRMQSVNDQPTNVDTCGTDNIKTTAETTVVYYYNKNSKHYIEQP